MIEMKMATRIALQRASPGLLRSSRLFHGLSKSVVGRSLSSGSLTIEKESRPNGVKDLRSSSSTTTVATTSLSVDEEKNDSVDSSLLDMLKEAIENEKREEATDLLLNANESTLTWSAFKVVLTSWSKDKGKHAANTGERILRKWIQTIQNQTIQIKPEESLRAYFNIVIHLWSTCTIPPQRIKLKNVRQGMGYAMHAFSLMREPECRPNRFTYQLIMNCFVHVSISASSAFKRDEGIECIQIAQQAAQKTEQLLSEMIASGDPLLKPNATSYKAALTAWSNVRSLEGADKACTMIQEMEEFLGEIDPHLYSIVLNSYAQAAPLAGDFDPANDHHPANKVVQLLRGLLESQIPAFRQRRVPLQVPDAMCYAAVINALAKSTVSQDHGSMSPAHLASATLQQCEELHDGGVLKEGPNALCYGNTIAAWFRHTDAERACEQVLGLLSKLENWIQGKPNRNKTEMVVVWYNMVLNLLAKSVEPEAVQRAEEILKRMRSTADARSYQAVIETYASNPHVPKPASKAVALLERMDKPPIACQNTALKACAAEGNVSTAESIFRRIRRPNQSTYARMLTVYFALDDSKERDMRVSKLFEQCCKGGHVGFLVLNILNDNASPQFVEALVGNEIAASIHSRTLDLNDLPVSWTVRRSNHERNESAE